MSETRLKISLNSPKPRRKSHPKIRRQDAPEDDDYDDEADDGEDVYDDDDDDEEVDEEPAETLYTVKVDGKEVEVNLEEALKGYQRQEAFTKRSMELAEQRKAFAAEAAETKQLRDAYAPAT